MCPDPVLRVLQNLWQTYKQLFLTQAAEHFKGLSTIWQGEPEIEAVGCNPGRLHRRGLLGAGFGRLHKSSSGGDDGKGVLSRGSNDRYQLFHSTTHPHNCLVIVFGGLEIIFSRASCLLVSD